MNETSELIQQIINRLLQQKGRQPVSITGDSEFFGGEIPIDSLDLAVLVTELQNSTGKDPFKTGFRNFRTVGELASLYA